MAIAATLLTSGNSATNATSYATASVTPTANALVLVGFMHIANSAPVSTSTIYGGWGYLIPIACVVLDNTNYAGSSPRTAVLEVHAVADAAPSAGALTMDCGVTQNAAAWAVCEVTGMDTTAEGPLAGLGAIRRVSPIQADGDSATSVVAPLGRSRETTNGVLMFTSHLVNEATTPGSGLTELADQANADTVNIHLQWAASPIARPSASWSTATTSFGAIGLEIAVPSNTMFVSDAEAALHA